MKVRIPSPLRSYTGGKDTVSATGTNIGELLFDLDSSYPGICFRIIDEQDRVRPHIQLFINNEQTRDLSQAVAENDTIHIIAALSGG